MKIATWVVVVVVVMMVTMTTMTARENRRHDLNFHNMVFVIYTWQIKVVYDT
jgi:hypothetical protein